MPPGSGTIAGLGVDGDYRMSTYDNALARCNLILHQPLLNGRLALRFRDPHDKPPFRYAVSNFRA